MENQDQVTALQRAQEAVTKENPDLPMPLKFEVTPPDRIEELLSIQDLTADDVDPNNIIRSLFASLLTRLELNNFSSIRVYRGSAVVSADDNFDSLRFTPGNPGRSSTYTRYVDGDHVLRTHTSAQIPGIFRELKREASSIDFKTIVMPGLVYRRDVIDPRHLDVFHQIDIWTLQNDAIIGRSANRQDLLKLVETIFSATCPNAKMKVLEAKHPYTVDGIEVYAVSSDGTQEFEVLEAGLVHPDVLRLTGLDPSKYSGLALGMGLERLIMARKKLPDIRMIRSTDPRIQKQMRTFEIFKPVSSMPAISRDMSICIKNSEREEDICERIKDVFGDAKEMIENVEILDRVPFEKLTETARARLGAQPGQDNILIRITLRHPDRTLTKQEATELYKIAYRKLHEGTGWDYAL